MPRQPKFSTELVAVAPALPEPYPQVYSQAMVASAANLRNRSKSPQRIFNQTDKNWQAECYRHYSVCGEARFAARFFGHALSRAVLSVAKPDDNGGFKPVTEGPAVDYLNELFAGKDGQEQMLEAAGVHFTVAGEFYLVGRQIRDQNDPLFHDVAVEHLDQVWEVVSVVEMQVTGNQWSIKHEGHQPIDLTDDDVVIRVWQPDPADRTKADSPFKALLSTLREIEWSTQHLFAQISSRLVASGIMWVSQDISFPPPPESMGVPKNEMEGLMWSLAAHFEERIKSDPSSPAAVSPIMVSVPGEVLKSGKPAELMNFWSPLDEKAMDIRKDAIRRFAIGLEMPPEQLMGMSSNTGTGGGSSNGVSHWGAWQIEESTIKMFVEPALDTLVNAITVAYLRPLLFDDTSQVPVERIVHSTKALKLRPDRSKEAMELNDRGILKDEVAARENGFSKEDVMGPEERKAWLVRKVATGSPTPEMVWGALGEEGVDLPRPPATAQPIPGPQSDRSLEDHPSRPSTPQAAALIPLYESLVLRALERSGNRIRHSAGNPKLGVPSYEVHTMVAANGSSEKVLEDAWATAPRVLCGIEGVEPDEVIGRLNAYCLERIQTQQPHTREALADFMETA